MSSMEAMVKQLKYDADGLIPAVVQDARTRQVLMVAYMNAEALLATIRTGKTNFWSRSRRKYWVKGESSGHTQDVHSIRTDCDMDTLVIEGPEGRLLEQPIGDAWVASVDVGARRIELSTEDGLIR